MISIVSYQKFATQIINFKFSFSNVNLLYLLKMKICWNHLLNYIPISNVSSLTQSFFLLNTSMRMVFIEYLKNLSDWFITRNGAFIDFLWCSSSMFTKSEIKFSKNLNQDLISVATFTSNQQWKTNKFHVESVFFAFISSLMHLSFCLSLSFDVKNIGVLLL